MMVLRQLLGQLEPREFPLGDHAPHHARMFQDREVPIGGALRGCRPPGHDVGHRDRFARAPQHVDQGSTLRSVSLTHSPQPRLDRRVEIARHGRHHRSASSVAGRRETTLRRVTETTANTAAAMRTIVPPGAVPQILDAANPAITEDTLTAIDHRSVERNDRARICPLATGSTIIAAISRMPTIRMAATTATAVNTASTLFTNPTGRPETRDQS